MTAHLKIRDLELIVALHEEGTLTQAAKRVGVTEPALSKRLLLIERQVQARLFDRGHEGATITGAGRHFVEHIQESIHSYHRAVHEAQEAKRGEHHKLRIGASAYLPSDLIELVRSIELRLFRDLVIELATEYFTELMAKLHRHQIDLASAIGGDHHTSHRNEFVHDWLSRRASACWEEVRYPCRSRRLSVGVLQPQCASADARPDTASCGG